MSIKWNGTRMYYLYYLGAIIIIYFYVVGICLQFSFTQYGYVVHGYRYLIECNVYKHHHSYSCSCLFSIFVYLGRPELILSRGCSLPWYHMVLGVSSFHGEWYLVAPHQLITGQLWSTWGFLHHDLMLSNSGYPDGAMICMAKPSHSAWKKHSFNVLYYQPLQVAVVAHVILGP